MKRLFCLVALTSALGCGPKLDQTWTFDIDSSKNEMKILDPIRTAQKIKVDVHATGGPIDVSVFLEKNRNAAEKEIYAKGGSNLLADKREIESATFDVSVPAAESAVIEVKASSLKKAKVTLKVTN
ncbi:MAG TPA: hypothetical protein VHR72_03260 [Gemmataceae bacterium]|jgi:hypothetical protein|nr:hypothetical protein [Gemmataceae bacterium]